MTSSIPPTDTQWRKCSSCKNPIRFSAKYWVCNVSTCNRKRTGLAFCSVSCWDAHLPLMNHRESWAEERIAPTAARWAEMQIEETQPRKRAPRAPSPETNPAPSATTTPARAAPVLIRRKSGS